MNLSSNLSGNTNLDDEDQTNSDSDHTSTSDISEESSKSSQFVESEDSLASLKNLVENYIHPYHKEYNEFATSYISSKIPSQNRILCDETGSYTAIPLPFKTTIKVHEFALQEKRRKEIGESERKGKIIPSSKVILKEIKNSSENIKSEDLRKSYFFYKAKQWCEVTKALAIDAKYPKVNASVIRDKYSSEHRKATELARKAKRLRDNARMFEAKSQVSPFPIPLELITGGINLKLPGYQAMAKVVQEEEIGLAELRETLTTLLSDIEPIAELQMKTEEPWQFKARKTSLLKHKPIKKPTWKKTEYPPKSREEKIAELRKLLPEEKPEDLQTDYLSGIWEPELMSESFSISGLNYDSRITLDRAQVDWSVVHDAKEKCKNWLLAIPD